MEPLRAVAHCNGSTIDPRPARRDNWPMLNKILLTIIVIAVVWLGFKYWSRFVAGPGARASMPRRQRPEKRETSQDEAVHETVQCRVCGSYVTAPGRRCGRHDCPF